MDLNGTSVEVTLFSPFSTTASEYTTRCLPNVTAYSPESATSYATETLVDLSEASGALGAALGFSLVYSSLFLVLMYYCAGCTVWLAIILAMVALAIAGYFFFFLATCTKADQETMSSCGKFSQYSINTFWFGAALNWGLLVIFAIMVLFLRKRILLAIKLIKQATVAIKDMPHMLVLPLAKIVLITCVVIWWVAVTTALGSAGTLKTESDNATFTTNPHECALTEFSYCSYLTTPLGSNQCCDFVSGVVKSVDWNQTLWGMFFYHLFGLLWTCAFLLAAMNFTLSSATCQWYFAVADNDKSDLGTPVLTGVKRAFGVHGGTLAFGSFLVATLEMIRMIVDYMARKANKEAKKSGNKVIQCITGCITCIAMCCVRCVEHCIKFITSEAYIFTALFGRGLCPSVKSTFAFLAANGARKLVLSGIGNAVVFISKLFVVGMTGVSTYALLIYTKPWSVTVQNPWLPLVIACSIGYLVCRLFMAVFARTLDTLLVCFVADEEMQRKHGSQLRQKSLADSIKKDCPSEVEEC